MAAHRGNASFTDVVASDCSQTFKDFTPISYDPHVEQLIVHSLNSESYHIGHCKVFKLRHFVVLTFNIALRFASSTPDLHKETHISLPQYVRTRLGTYASAPVFIRNTLGDVTFTSHGSISSNGTIVNEEGQTTQADRLELKTFGLFLANHTYVIRGTVQIEPSIA